MITTNEFKKGKKVIYADFGIKSYCTIELVKITKRRKNHFWFDAMIVDNSTLDNDNTKKFHAVGTLHSFSNSFIYENLNDLKSGEEAYIETQVEFVENYFGINN